MREKLIELLYDNVLLCKQKFEGLADDVLDLIANGVTFDKDINALTKKIAALEKSNRNWRRKTQKIRQRYAKNNKAGWIPVTERLPEKYGRYLALTPGYLKGFDQYDAWLIYYHPQSGFYDNDPEWGDIPMDDVTHWMPLPEPPKGE